MLPSQNEALFRAVSRFSPAFALVTVDGLPQCSLLAATFLILSRSCPNSPFGARALRSPHAVPQTFTGLVYRRRHRGAARFRWLARLSRFQPQAVHMQRHEWRRKRLLPHETRASAPTCSPAELAHASCWRATCGGFEKHWKFHGLPDVKTSTVRLGHARTSRLAHTASRKIRYFSRPALSECRLLRWRRVQASSALATLSVAGERVPRTCGPAAVRLVFGAFCHPRTLLLFNRARLRRLTRGAISSGKRLC